MSVEAAAREISVSDATLYRFESGTSVPRPPDVMVLCSAYGGDQRTIDALIALAKEADAPGWWRSYKGAIPEWFDTFVSLESAADQICAYESEVIFGLLQTQPYAEAVIKAASPPGADHDGLMQVRLTRQRILQRRNPPRLDVILGEAALVRSAGDDIMAQQLAHLDAVSRRPNVTLRVLPLGVLHRAIDCGARFTVLMFPTDRRGSGEPPVVFADNLTGAAYLDKPEEVKEYDAVWQSVLDAALPPAESRKTINSYRERCEQR